GLVRVARRLGPCAGWDKAVVAVRNAPTSKLARAVARGLAEQDPSLGQLWAALRFEEYRDVLAAVARGPAAAADPARRAVHDFPQLGKHAWHLQEEEVVQVFNLKLAQRHILRACGSVLGRPGAIAAALRQDYDPLAYLAFVLAYTARRGAAGARPRPADDERRPAPAQPDDADWLRAWAHAAFMAPDAVTALLLERDDLQNRRPQVLADALRAALVPAPDAARVADLYYTRGRSVAQIAGELGL